MNISDQILIQVGLAAMRWYLALSAWRERPPKFADFSDLYNEAQRRLRELEATCQLAQSFSEERK